jgi:HD-like signal output (HDOD) protein
LVIYENIPEEARTIMGKFKESDELLHNIEKELLGFDHARVGMALMEAWKLPRYLQNAVGYHHSPDKAKSNIVDCSIVHLADVFTKSMEIGSSGDPYIPPVEPQAWEEVGISTSQLPSIWKKIEKQYNETVQIILIN